MAHEIGNKPAERHLAAELVPLSFDASAVPARRAVPPRSCSGAECELARVHRQPDASSCLDLRGGKRHPLPTLPHQGGGLQGEVPCLKNVRSNDGTFIGSNIDPLSR